ncbi:hypothetical protein VNO80_25877 [Phaseolus coccineus]|uniref:Uncharacterized protein n=1 Tax=Phaseolus coccineus TaxID=3886 RepID=A0AAN9QP41_PHACN
MKMKLLLSYMLCYQVCTNKIIVSFLLYSLCWETELSEQGPCSRPQISKSEYIGVSEIIIKYSVKFCVVRIILELCEDLNLLNKVVYYIMFSCISFFRRSENRRNGGNLFIVVFKLTLQKNKINLRLVKSPLELLSMICNVFS